MNRNYTLGTGVGNQLALPGASVPLLDSEVPALPPLPTQVPALPANQEGQPPWMGLVLSCPQPALGKHSS